MQILLMVIHVMNHLLSTVCLRVAPNILVLAWYCIHVSSKNYLSYGFIICERYDNEESLDGCNRVVLMIATIDHL